MNRTRALIASVGAALLLVGLTAAPSSAGVVERDRYADTEVYTYPACGYDVQETDAVKGHFMLRQHGSAVRAYVFDQFFVKATYTNLQTNRSWTTTTKLTHLDVHIVPVGGTVYRYTWQDAGIFKVFDESGKLAYTQAGLRRTTALVDTHGNLDLDDDEFLAELDFQLHGHYGGTGFCDDLQDFTTG